MKNDFQLLTEERNPASMDIDLKSTREIVGIINSEDARAAHAVQKELDSVARIVDLVADALSRGGRLFYVGAGTSGRLAVLDAVECPPTYGVDPSMVQGILAGGMEACYRAVEASEDDASLGEQNLRQAGVSARDMIVAISASGRTPYCVGAVRYAKSLGASTAAVVCTPNSLLSTLADVTVAVVAGPEVITGSTRMKAGTAQKMVLNMISTAAFIRLGYVFGNLMINVHLKNEKLIERGKRVLMAAAGVEYGRAEQAIESSGHDLRVALVMLLQGISAAEARKRLDQCGGNLRQATAPVSR